MRTINGALFAFLLVGVTGFPLIAIAADVSQAEPVWRGFFGLFGSETRMALGGFVQLDVIHDTRISCVIQCLSFWSSTYPYLPAER